jgi:hypothetical protein
MEKVDYNEKERLAWSSYVFLEKENKKKKPCWLQAISYGAAKDGYYTSTTPTKRSNRHSPAKK